MLKLIAYLWITFAVIAGRQTFPDFHPLPDADYFESTSIRIDSLAKHTVQLGFDGEGVPLFYRSLIYTEVCQSDDCKPIRVTVFWDLVGDYIKYEIPDNHPFTKMDHEEFVLEDYKKMHRILSNPKSVLSSYKLEELVSSETGAVHNNVDGISGATIKTVQKDVIEGAAYTCHTLWHLLHGEEKQFLTYTDKMINRELGCKLLKSGKVVQQRLAMSYLGGQEYLLDCEVNALWSIIQSENVFVAQQAFYLLPVASLETEYAQRAFWLVFTELPFVLQSTALRKFKNETNISSYIRLQISSLYKTASYGQCEQILELIEKEQSWNADIYDRLLQGLKNREKPYRDLMVKHLREQTSVSAGVLIKIIEDYE